MVGNGMKFKTFIWPAIPEKIKITREELVEISHEYVGNMVARGELPNKISGEGRFFGPSALTDFFKLIALLKEKTSGVFEITGFDPAWGYLAAVELLEAPGPSLVHYSFIIYTDPRVMAATPPSVSQHTVAAGDTLFSVAGQYNVSVEVLVRHNTGVIQDLVQLPVGQNIWLKKPS